VRSRDVSHQVPIEDPTGVARACRCERWAWQQLHDQHAGLYKTPTEVQLDEPSWLSFRQGRGETLRAALERTLRDAIRAGALRAGVRLPASRVLAQSLGVSRGVVRDAYGQLEAQGFLVTRPRAAPVVATLPQPTTHPREASSPDPAPRYDLTPTTPDVALFPLNRWLATAQKAARQASIAALDYGDNRGDRSLREALADHLGRTRGVIAEPEQIIVVQGTAQAVDLVLRLLSRRGASRVAVEDPSHPTNHERIRALGLEVVGQPVDAEGTVAAGLDADAVLLTPAHQFPTGSVLSGERRRQLLAWARDSGGLIIEDDYDAEFRYDREPVRALQGLAPQHVVQLGTVSKTLAPALRLGWIVAPPELVDEAEHTKLLLDIFSPTLDQLALARFLTGGEYDRHVRRARTTYRRRRDRLLTALGHHLPDLQIEGVAAGLHLLLRLPVGASDRAIAGEAQHAGIAVTPLSVFQLAPTEAGGLVIGYGRLHEAAIDQALAALAEIVRPHL
jgi:GntR family transcriptional regulator / MocR family aminotransferase